MVINDIIKYVLYTPNNTNKKILTQMLEQLILDHGGELNPDEKPDHIIYDGGIEE